MGFQGQRRHFVIPSVREYRLELALSELEKGKEICLKAIYSQNAKAFMPWRPLKINI